MTLIDITAFLSPDSPLLQFLKDFMDEQIEAYAIVWKAKDSDYEWDFEGKHTKVGYLISRLEHIYHLNADAEEGLEIED